MERAEKALLGQSEEAIGLGVHSGKELAMSVWQAGYKIRALSDTERQDGQLVR